MAVQIFGTHKSQDTKKALRFFKERRVALHFVDLRLRAIAMGELKRFVERYGASALVDDRSKAYADAGLAYLKIPEAQLLARLVDQPELLKQPLIRAGSALSVGWDESYWRRWYQEHKEVA